LFKVGKDCRIIVNVLDTESGCNYLKLFDSELRQQHQAKVFEFSLIGSDKYDDPKNLYCISRAASSSHLRIYNWKLEYVNSIGSRI
jgi:hypothetical protein